MLGRSWSFLWLAALAALSACGGDPASDGAPFDASNANDARVVSAGSDAAVRSSLPEAGADEPTNSALDASVSALDAGLLDARTAAQDARAPAPDASLASASCATYAPTSCPSPAPRYADVEPIFRERCVICHSPRWTGPWPLDAYQHVSDWQDDIRSAMLDCSMPPPDAGVPVPTAERMQILTWIRCGLPM
jgi:hypothetical protein